MDQLYTFQNDILAVFLIFAYVLIWIIISEWLARSNKMDKEEARKVLHVMAGNVIFIIPLFHNYALAVVVPAFFILGNYLMCPYSPIEKLRLKTFDAGHALGTVYYAIALTILVAVFFDNPIIIFISFLPVAYGDGMAAAIGVRANSMIFSSVGGRKSVQGTLAMLLASFLSIIIVLILFEIEYFWQISLIIASGATLLELLSPKGLDNLGISLGVAFILYPLLVNPYFPISAL